MQQLELLQVSCRKEPTVLCQC